MIYSADELHKVSEVQTMFHWDAEFSGPMFAGFEERLRKRVTTMDLPKGMHSGFEVNTHGYTFPSPGRVNRNGELTLAFNESVTADVIEHLHRCQNNIWSSTDNDVTGIQQVDHFDLFGTITMRLKDKRDQDTQIYTLYRCLIGDVDQGGQLTDGSGPDYFKPIMNIRYSWFSHRVV